MSQAGQASCPSCGGTVKNDGSLAGQAVACPFCTASFVMPAFTPAPAGAPPAPSATPLATASPAMGWTAMQGHGMECPHCRSRMVPTVRSQMSGAGLAVLIVLAITCLPLFWIGFFITEEIRECSNCRMRVG